jgi:hypothetical protein
VTRKAARKKPKLPTKVARVAASKKPEKRTPTTPARKKASTPKKAVKKQAEVPSPKTFAENVRDAVPGTEVWYLVGEVVTPGTIQGPGSAGSVDVLSNGSEIPVPAGNLFDTPSAARHK